MAGRPLGDVEVDLQRAPLAPCEVRRQRQRHLGRLAQHRAAGGQEQVLDRLHGDRRGAARAFPLHGFPRDGGDRAPVHARMRAEPPVLGRQHRGDEGGREVLQRPPFARVAAPAREIGEHERRDRVHARHRVKADQGRTARGRRRWPPAPCASASGARDRAPSARPGRTCVRAFARGGGEPSPRVPPAPVPSSAPWPQPITAERGTRAAPGRVVKDGGKSSYAAALRRCARRRAKMLSVSTSAENAIAE